MSIQVQDLSFSYGKQAILQKINFQLQPGELVAVFGPNGTGKSTLFRCLLGLLNYQGRIQIEGQEISRLSPIQRAAKIAYIPQSSYPAFNYPVLDMVLMGLARKLNFWQEPAKKEVQQAQAILANLGLEYLSNRAYGEISGGERQLVLLARALIQDTRILLLDEPTANLDYANQYRVWQKVRELTQSGYTILLSTHNPEPVFWYADRVLVLQKGEVAAFGKPAAVLSEDLLEELWGLKINLHDYCYQERNYRFCLPAEE